MAANLQPSRRQQTLELLRFPLAVAVLTIHIWNQNALNMQGQLVEPHHIPLFREINIFIDSFLRHQCVPIYFFISGFVFFLGVDWNRETYFRKLKNRVRTLLIPYLIWNTAAIAILTIKYLPFLECFRTNYSDFHFSFKALLSCFWNYTDGFYPILLEQRDPFAMTGGIWPINIPLWFLRDLMIVVAATPLLYRLLKSRKGKYTVTALGAVWFISGYWNLWHVNQLLCAFFFFSWGAYLSIRKKDMQTEFARYFRLSMWAYPLLGLLYVEAVHWYPEAALTINRLNILAGLLFAYNAASWLLEHNICRPNPFLAASSFFIYVTHYMIHSRLRRIISVLLRPESDMGFVAVYTLTTILVVGLLLGLFLLMKRYTPQFLKIAIGRQ